MCKTRAEMIIETLSDEHDKKYTALVLVLNFKNIIQVQIQKNRKL